MHKQIKSKKKQAGILLAPFVWGGFALYFYGLWELAEGLL